MLRKLAEIFSCRPEPSRQRSEEESIRLATATVLVEIAYADDSFSPVERGELIGYLKRLFDLHDESAEELVSAAEELRKKTIDHFAIANYLRKNVPLETRTEIVKAMWRMVWADGALHAYEEYLIRKLSDLLGLEHHQMIAAKLAVQAENPAS